MTFTIAATGAFAFLAIIWNRTSWLNLFLKLAFTALALWGAFLITLASGYVVKVAP